MLSLIKDPLVLAKDFGFQVESAYFNAGLSSTDSCHIRLGIANRLKKALQSLPSGYNFKIWDGYRTTDVQQRLYDDFFAKLKSQHPEWADLLLHEGVCEFVSPPTKNPLIAAPHNTGGTVDLTIIDDNGNELPMGTGFDHFDVQAHTYYYEKTAEGSDERVFHQNRMILYKALMDVGFYNFPEEWWHFSYGDALWAKHYNESILYASCEISDEELADLNL
jgi:zinc D-Ala-D-Ala dipeptidase